MGDHGLICDFRVVEVRAGLVCGEGRKRVKTLEIKTGKHTAYTRIKRRSDGAIREKNVSKLERGR
jgi:hypothetical protein